MPSVLLRNPVIHLISYHTPPQGQCKPFLTPTSSTPQHSLANGSFSIYFPLFFPFIFLFFPAKHFTCSIGFNPLYPFGGLRSKISLFIPPALCLKALQGPCSPCFYLQEFNLAQVLCLLCSSDFLA